MSDSEKQKAKRALNKIKNIINNENKLRDVDIFNSYTELIGYKGPKFLRSIKKRHLLICSIASALIKYSERKTTSNQKMDLPLLKLLSQLQNEIEQSLLDLTYEDFVDRI
jgi:hypothetical protein